ncbi:MAG: cobalamin biosynthesis protein CobQ [Rhodobacteraceae bacterium]|nr:cobalamin biosynthesis protein CobQ [Paracoccaceae bacterium]
MNTPAHLIFGLAAFGHPKAPKVTACALLGSIIPDLSLYFLAGTHLFVMGTPPEEVFGRLYFSAAWQQIFSVDNSFVLWTVALILALWARQESNDARYDWAVALCGAAMLHLALDFPLHAEDARAHFWPLSSWVFHSPLSYWDSRHYGAMIGVIEALSVAGLSVFLWRRFGGWRMRAAIAVLVLVEIVPRLMFIGGGPAA